MRLEFVYSCVGSPIYQRRYKMNVIKRICFFAIFLYTSLFTSVAIAVDTYDASTNKLTIPSVAVGDTLYSNVVISVGSVISASTTAKADSYDTYDFSSGKLSIPVVVVGTNIYYSVVSTNSCWCCNFWNWRSIYLYCNYISGW